MQEGSNWEALMVAPKLNLNNLLITIDYNDQQSFGPVTQTMSIEPIEEKLHSFGWSVYRNDGHNIPDMINTFKKAMTESKPLAMVADTKKGKGVSFMEDQTKWHYSPPNQDEYEKALKEIDKRYT